MNEDLELETYIHISPNVLGIYLFDIKNQKNLYKQELELVGDNNMTNLKNLESFLADNIFEVEKLAGKFIKNIYLILENNNISNISFSIKKKNYETKISKKYLENTIIEAKDLFKENYQNEKIMHIVIKKYLINDKYYKNYEDNLIGDHLCLEMNFISISKDLALEIEEILEKFQIRIRKYFDKKYITNFFDGDPIELSNLAHKIQIGTNINEVDLVPKKSQKIGIFERFFQLFS